MARSVIQNQYYLISSGHKAIVPAEEQIAQTNGKTFHYWGKVKSGEIRFFYLDETPATLWSSAMFGHAKGLVLRYQWQMI